MNLLAIMTKQRAIGRNNKIPWQPDLQNFRKLTVGNVIIMGRKTFESIGRPLPDRVNIVVSSSLRPKKGIIVCKSIEDALKKAKSFKKEVFVIGGASIYEQTIDLADKMYISYVKKAYKGDKFFPKFKKSDWKVESRKNFPNFELVVYSK